MSDSKRTRGRQEASHNVYLDGLQLLAEHSQRHLAQLMPHNGELGRNAEEILKSILEKILPKRFSVGTGVIINARGEVSQQTDIVIYDGFYNSPLLSEFGSCVYPAEMVYATIEVKTVLKKSELDASIDAIMRLRHVGKQRHYLVPDFEETSEGKRKAISRKLVITVPPRNFIFAFKQSGLGPTYQDFCTKLTTILEAKNAHVHGVCVLDKNWFAARKAYRVPAELFGQHGNGLLTFYYYFLKAQENYLMYPMDLEVYLRPPNTKF
ncbi:DUF6602 domain-containing protein [Bradyrhizobium ottawaense]|uniref:DUF6602 domain-containing protein n=1 Tax=Bradyrhizobium ottawaense TaxID=931866 RepID=UPI0027D556A1|nr:hypothetical protein BwSH12_77830 [Bradyrhizobium ottawaense]GMO78848.1 hypothetical protein BwSG10_48540 [Bradyrhizobium ottawaense]GMP00680.1 hypothetical protein BwSH20_29680 [Bradyrhizobium ottawaense]GMP05451.1 hypothetical protein BwDG23_48540 [Bradyrhizobium ottawaense]